jgi:hypothetical protein
MKDLHEWIKGNNADCFPNCIEKEKFVSEKLIPMINKFYALDDKKNAILHFESPDDSQRCKRITRPGLKVMSCGLNLLIFS